MDATPKKKSWDEIKPKIEESLTAEGFDDAFIGVIRRCGKPAMFVYNYQKCIEILMAGGIATEEEAIEHMEFNVVGSWVGEGTPGLLVSFTMEETLDAL